jgi:hypothetical protein
VGAVGLNPTSLTIFKATMQDERTKKAEHAVTSATIPFPREQFVLLEKRGYIKTILFLLRRRKKQIIFANNVFALPACFSLLVCSFVERLLFVGLVALVIFACSLAVCFFSIMPKIVRAFDEFESIANSPED